MSLDPGAPAWVFTKAGCLQLATCDGVSRNQSVRPGIAQTSLTRGQVPPENHFQEPFTSLETLERTASQHPLSVKATNHWEHSCLQYPSPEELDVGETLMERGGQENLGKAKASSLD